MYHQSSQKHQLLTQRIQALFMFLSIPSPLVNTFWQRYSNYLKKQIVDTQLPHTAASDLTLDEEAIFVLAYPSSDVLLVRQTLEGRCTAMELKFESIIPRFLSGIADKFRCVKHTFLI